MLSLSVETIDWYFEKYLSQIEFCRVWGEKLLKIIKTIADCSMRLLFYINLIGNYFYDRIKSNINWQIIREKRIFISLYLTIHSFITHHQSIEIVCISSFKVHYDHASVNINQNVAIYARILHRGKLFQIEQVIRRGTRNRVSPRLVFTW